MYTLISSYLLEYFIDILKIFVMVNIKNYTKINIISSYTIIPRT